MKYFLVVILALIIENASAGCGEKKCGELHCPMIPSSCPSGETLTTPIDSNGCSKCPQCTKCVLLFCPSVAKMKCAYGIVYAKQSNGCPGCPVCRACSGTFNCPMIPAECPDGETLTSTTDSNGCPGCSQCCAELNCPMTPDECPDGEAPTSSVLPNGCPGCQSCTPVLP